MSHIRAAVIVASGNTHLRVAAPARSQLAAMRSAGPRRHAGGGGVATRRRRAAPRQERNRDGRGRWRDAGAAVAVIGAGIMGSAMTRNLVAAGLTTRVWDRSASATGPLADAGAVVAASAPDAVRDAGGVITMLPTAPAGESGIFDGGAAARCAGGRGWGQ